ncbi:MAG: amidase family protein, partial [Pseudomonadota bacterium]
RGERQSSSQSCVGVHAGSLRDLWQVTHEIARRTGGDPGHPGLFGPAAPPTGTRPGRLIVMECTGWRVTDSDTRQAFEQVLQSLRDAGVAVLRRGDHPHIDRFEDSLESANAMVGTILAYENRWIYENLARKHSTLSASTLEALDKARALSVDDYRAALASRRHAQQCFADLAPLADALMSPTSPGPATRLDTPPPAAGAPIFVATGNPVFNLPASLLLAPVVALPLMAVRGLPVGVQLVGQLHDDYRLTDYAQWMTDNIRPVSVS